jgi:hemerythrin-like domain-containing protein
VPIAGKDFKTGQTLIKTVIAPMLKARMLGLSGWYSTNILGNRDGEVLDDPESFHTKEKSKLGVLEEVLDPDRYRSRTSGWTTTWTSSPSLCLLLSHDPRSTLDGEEAPGSGYALELVFTAVGEREPRARHQVLHRARHDDVAAVAGGRHPGADVHGEPSDPLASHLHLPGVHADPDRDPDPVQSVMESAGAVDGAARPVEGGEESVAGVVDLVSTEPCQLLAHDGVVLVEERAPARVTDGGSARGGVHDVGEEDGGEPSVRVRRGSISGEELLDLVHHLVAVLREPDVVGPVELHVSGIGDVVGQIPAELGRSDLIMCSLQDQGRRLDDGQQLADVGQHRLPEVVSDRAGRDRTPPEADELLGESGIADSAGYQKRHVVGIAGSPRFRLALDDVEEQILRRSPRVVGGGGESGRRVHQHERTTSLRQGGGQEKGERATLGEAEDRGLLRPGGIHDCTDVRHLGLEIGETIERHRIGEARSPPVEDDQAPDGRQPPPLARQLRELPERLDVVHPTLDQHQVERAFAHDLVREVDLAVLRVLGRRHTVHGSQAWQSTGPVRCAVSPDRSKPDLTFVNLTHQALRADGARLAATVAALQPRDPENRLPGVRDFYDHYREQLVAHHTHEDTLFYPALAARVGDDRMHRDELVAQHHQLDGVLQRVGDGLADLADPDGDFSSNRTRVVGDLSTMVEELNTHLDFEERTALPLFVSDMPVAEYKKLESEARKATPREEAGFLIPWIVEHASPDQRKALFRSAPPLRIVNWLKRRRYRRLDSCLVPESKKESAP